MSGRPERLEPSLVEKVWGSEDLAPWFPDPGSKIGEVWFPADDILVKFIFTTDRLSVQVHPPGKTEMWYVLRAEAGSGIALGFKRPCSKEVLREAAVSGEIEDLLEFFPVAPGDAFLNEPGMVHALGSGLVICEIQQNYPVTYRLYDYGRPRELHLEEAVAVARCERHPGKFPPLDLASGVRRVVECEYFATDVFHMAERFLYRPEPDRPHLLIFAAGRGMIANEPFRAGELWWVPAGCAPFAIVPAADVEMLRTYAPHASSGGERGAT